MGTTEYRQTVHSKENKHAASVSQEKVDLLIVLGKSVKREAAVEAFTRVCPGMQLGESVLAPSDAEPTMTIRPRTPWK